MSEEQKQELLASLEALDQKPNNSYEPSFLDRFSDKKRTSLVEDSHSHFSYDHADGPFSSSVFKSLDSSIQSVKSSLSVDSDKKAKLMKELFNNS